MQLLSSHCMIHAGQVLPCYGRAALLKKYNVKAYHRRIFFASFTTPEFFYLSLKSQMNQIKLSSVVMLGRNTVECTNFNCTRRCISPFYWGVWNQALLFVHNTLSFIHVIILLSYFHSSFHISKLWFLCNNYVYHTFCLLYTSDAADE